MKKEKIVDENKTTSKRITEGKLLEEIISILIYIKNTEGFEGLEGFKDHYIFLRERENKLQKIEQMFKSGSVDLGDLAELVEEK